MKTLQLLKFRCEKIVLELLMALSLSVLSVGPLKKVKLKVLNYISHHAFLMNA